VAERVLQRRIVGALREQALQRLYGLAHVPGLLQDDRALVLERRMLGMRAQSGIQQLQRRIGAAVVPEELCLRDSQIDRVSGMPPRVLLEQSESRTRVMRSQQQ